ncbi:hypothetical protein DM813_23225 [Pseudomonas alkylphenolica]|uniref:DUF3987 domain-containing protein n=1 Tax=Pseudomonas alkylphenolica TaxID=237609 RepID=A0A443ZJZ2_9PSED|nr:DUF3987 domain-containing protein [Pseudomonas alkylphenolica]RWU19220.1 hypothetical protein DM813_23225 [Pseudomonas alkylphenolica]
MTAPLVTAPSYPEPVPLLPNPAPPISYPIDSLPELMQAAARSIAEHVQAPMALAGQCVIAAATHLAQTRVNAPDIHNPHGMPCSLFMLSLGCSGDRKSSCRKLAFKIIDQAEREARIRHRQLCEELKAEADMYKGKKRDEFLSTHPVPLDPRTQFADATYEPIVGGFIRGNSTASWDTDEGGQVLGGYSLNERSDTRAATIGGLSRGHDTGIFERTRAHGNLEGSGFAYNRRLSIHLMAQPVTVAKALADPLLIGQGFLPRVLFASPDSLAGTRHLTIKALRSKIWENPHLQSFWARCEELISSKEYIDPETGEVTPPVLRLTNEAELVWLDFYNEVESEQGPLGRFSGLRPFAGRAPELARRVSAVFACFEGANVIDCKCIRHACEIVRYSLMEWLRYTESNSINPELQQAADLLVWLRNPERVLHWREFTLDRLGKSGPQLVRKATKRDQLIAILLKYSNLLPGNGDKTFKINPRLLADSADPEERPKIHGIKVAEKVRESAENLRSEATPVKNPQLSAKFPQNGTPAKPGFPQNPRDPQAPHISEADNEGGMHFTGEI